MGRDGEIRTRDPLHPMQVRYQAAPRPEPRNRTAADGVAAGMRTIPDPAPSPEVDVEPDNDSGHDARVQDLPDAVRLALVRDGALGYGPVREPLELRRRRLRRHGAHAEDHDAGRDEQQEAEVQP